MTIRRELQLQENSQSSLAGVDVEVARIGARSLRLRWVVRGAIRNLRLPKLNEMESANSERTCHFSLIARAEGEVTHLNLDLRPDGKWDLALFVSDDGRATKFSAGSVSQFDVLERLKPLTDDKRAKLKQAGFDTLQRFEPSFLSISATLDLKPNYVLPLDKDWLLDIAASLEEKNGNRSCWALGQPTGPADLASDESCAVRIPASTG